MLISLIVLLIWSHLHFNGFVKHVSEVDLILLILITMNTAQFAAIRDFSFPFNFKLRLNEPQTEKKHVGK